MDARLAVALGDVASLGPYFTLSNFSLPERARTGARPVERLYRDPALLGVRIDEVASALGSDRRVAASIAFQGLAAQLVSAPFALVVAHAMLPALTGQSLWFRPVSPGPRQLGPIELGWIDPGWTESGWTELAEAADGADALARLLISEHLLPLVAAVRGQVSIAGRVLWGNAGSALAGARRMVATARPELAEIAGRVAWQMLRVGPLAGTGERVPAVAPDREWTFRRRSCCLYYRVPGGGLCGDCVLQLTRAGSR